MPPALETAKLVYSAIWALKRESSHGPDYDRYKTKIDRHGLGADLEKQLRLGQRR